MQTETPAITMKRRQPRSAGGVWCARALLIALLFTHPILSLGSVSFVAQSSSVPSSSDVQSVAITAPAGLVTGDVLIAFLAQNSSNLPIIKGDAGDVPTGWTAVLSKDDGSSSKSIGVAVYSKVATSADVAGTTTYTWKFDHQDRSGGIMLDFRGVLTTSPMVISASQLNSASVDYTAPSITPGIANTELVVLFAAANSSSGMNLPTGMTIAKVGATGSGSDGPGLVMGAFIEALAASTATGTQKSTTNTSAVNIGVSLALKSIAGAAPDHFAISDAGTAVNCQASPVTITAHSASHTVVSTTDTITVSTSTGHGDWSLATGGGSFAAGAANSGTATYTYVTADTGAVILSLKDTFAETVTINVADGSATQSSGSAIGSEQPSLTFVASGFRITNGSNVAATIATQVAATSSTLSLSPSLALQAVRTDSNTGACTAVFANNTTVTVGLAYQCNNPTSCVAGQTLAFTNNSVTTNIASSANGTVPTYTPVSLKFSTANAEAPFSFSYSDVGQISLLARYFIPPSITNSMTGSSQFVVKPSTFSLTNIKCTNSTVGAASSTCALAAPGNNPAANSAFIQAGQAFSTTVTANNSAGAVTPNYGQETAPQGVTLSANLVLPAGGNAPALNNASAFGSFTAGLATGTAFNWPEVGIITLTPTVASYLGAGVVTGATSGNVGRFIPNAFLAVPNAPQFGTMCAKDLNGNPLPGGGFSYLGQPLTYTIAPVLTVTALSAAGSTTRNYTGAFFKLTNSTLSARTYTPTPASPALDSSGISTATDPAIADLGSGQPALSGQATLTFGMGSGTGLLFTRGAAVAPLSANISLSINVKDSDGVVPAPNPVSFGSAIAFSTSATQYYGRLALRDAVGSELLDLPMALTTQYYVSTTQGFTTNTNDSCTTLPSSSIVLNNFLLNLSFGNQPGGGKTCVRDSSSPGVSGAGCAVAAPVATAYNGKAVSGNFNLAFATPGSGSNGAMTVTATAPAGLQYTWAGGVNPTAIAAFGVFSGQASRVYQREVY
jgi:MSHA biogenesis protein MshQ